MNDISDLLPHSGKMILVDEILMCDDDRICTKSVIKDSPFTRDSIFPTYQIIEMMAQSLGLYKASLSGGKSGGLAFLVGSRKMEFFTNALKVGDIVICKTLKSMQDESGFGVYDCQSWLEMTNQSVLIACGTLSVFNPSKEKFMELKNV